MASAHPRIEDQPLFRAVPFDKKGFFQLRRQVFAKDHTARAGVKRVGQDVNHTPKELVHGLRLGLRANEPIKCLCFILTNMEIGAVQSQVGREAQLLRGPARTCRRGRDPAERRSHREPPRPARA